MAAFPERSGMRSSRAGACRRGARAPACRSRAGAACAWPAAAAPGRARPPGPGAWASSMRTAAALPPAASGRCPARSAACPPPHGPARAAAPRAGASPRVRPRATVLCAQRGSEATRVSVHVSQVLCGPHVKSTCRAAAGELAHCQHARCVRLPVSCRTDTGMDGRTLRPPTLPRPSAT